MTAVDEEESSSAMFVPAGASKPAGVGSMNRSRPLPAAESAPPTPSTTFTSSTFAGAESAWTRLSLVSIVAKIAISLFVASSCAAYSVPRRISSWKGPESDCWGYVSATGVSTPNMLVAPVPPVTISPRSAKPTMMSSM